MRYHTDYYSGNKIHFGSIIFSEKEIRDIIKAWLAISFAFAVLFAGGLGSAILMAFIISSLTVGVGFVFHEMGHKILAQKYGAWAEFRSWDMMLILGILMSFFGFIFIAPGAVMISGRTIGKSRNGKISAIGPAMNFIVAVLFLPFVFLFAKDTFLYIMGSFGVSINTIIGLFNLIPFAMFDGKKIFDWDRGVYIFLAVTGIALIGLAMYMGFWLW